jgi:DNA-binding XRE family transcriptional regulator
MTPAQMRMARAALYWSVDQLAEAAGVHRNTISNFETSKYAGDPETRAAIKRALETAGVVFVEENGEASVTLRRFREGDLVRLRPQSRLLPGLKDKVGTVLEVEPHPPQTGPTYRVSVEFPDGQRLPGVFAFEFRLVKAAQDWLGAKVENTTDDAKSVVLAFCDSCIWAWTVFDQYRKLYEYHQLRLALYDKVAKNFFGDLQSIFIDYVLLQFTKVTDQAMTMGNANLTTFYLLEKLSWPDTVRDRLKVLNDRLLSFRRHIVDARRKVIAHTDLKTNLHGTIVGAFPAGSDQGFLQDLQEFANIAHEHAVGGPYPIDAVTQYDADDLVTALKKAVAFDEYFEKNLLPDKGEIYFRSKYFRV